MYMCACSYTIAYYIQKFIYIHIPRLFFVKMRSHRVGQYTLTETICMCMYILCPC